MHAARHLASPSSSRTTTSCARSRGAQASATPTSSSSASATARSTPTDVVEFLAPPTNGRRGRAPPPEQLREGRIESLVRKVTGRDDGGIRLNGIDDVLVRYAKCCNPLPGDEIIGFITRGRGVTVHRRGCPKAFDTDPERRVEITWDAKAKINRPVQLRVMTANRPGILATVGHTFSEQGINISEANCRAGDDGRAVNVFTFVCS